MITKYGLPQAALYPGLLTAGGVTLAVFFFPAVWLLPVELTLLGLALWVLSFFRAPSRKIVPNEKTLYSPCDGTVTEIADDGETIRISMFLGLLNVHINCVPCSCRVVGVRYNAGTYRDARKPESARVNESNVLTLARLAEPYETIHIRQVSGAVARHIVCAVKEGDTLRQGERFGMIKFGSRTDMIIPEGDRRRIMVKPGDKVKAGLTALVQYTE